MELSKLLVKVDVIETIGSVLLDVKDIKIDSNSVTKGTLFICIDGESFDGHGFIKQAENYGAVAVISERVSDTSLPQIIVKNSRSAMSIIAKNFYGNSSDKLKIIGVTGTNGKTTTTHLIKSIFDRAGIKCGVIGTLGTYYDDVFCEPSLTTPDPIELHRIFADMVMREIKVAVMEVSAHALELSKVDGIKFEVGVITNITQDHLDFFGSMDNYTRAKLKLFEEDRCKFRVVNSDDDSYRSIVEKNANTVSFGIENPADVFALDVEEKLKGTQYLINLFDCVFEIKMELIGKFNVYNALAAATAAALAGVSTEIIASSLNSAKTVEGRMEPAFSGDYSVYVDYAHTPDGLKKAISALKPLCKKRLICVFGCGGNRDKGKRRKMGRISGESADFTVITSDNPRFEEPMEIISEIEEGLLEASKNYVIVQSRPQAIEYAINCAKSGDVVLIAGKGSEKYQEILGIKHVYNDKDTVKEIIGESI